MAKKKSGRPKRGADGLYHVQKYIGRREDGSRYYKWFRGKDWNELLLDVALEKKAFAAGQIPEEETHRKTEEEPKPRELTLIDAIDKYIDTCRVLHEQDPATYSVSTIASYVSYCRSIDRHPAFETVAHCPIRDVTVAALQDALNAVSRPDKDGRKLSTKTINNWYGVIKPALDAYGPDIRLDKIKKGKNKAKKPLVIRESDIPVVFRIALDIHPEFFLYILFISILGTRPSESYAFTWGDFSKEPMVSIEDGSVSYFGTVNIDKATVKGELRTYENKCTKTAAGERSLSRAWSFFETLYSVKPRGADDERIFTLKPDQLPYRWKKVKQQVALPDGMVMYDLRHYHCSVMAALGATDQYIADDMGHSDISISKKYYMEELHEKRQEINTAMYQHTNNLLDRFNGKQNTTDHATKQEKTS